VWQNLIQLCSLGELCLLGSIKGCLCYAMRVLNHTQYAVNQKCRVALIPVCGKEFAVWHPIPILVLICGLRTSLWGESVRKWLLTKRMTYAELILRCVSALKHKGTHGISYWPGGIIAVAWFKSYVCFNLGAQKVYLEHNLPWQLS